MLPFLAKTLICSGLFYGLYYILLRKETFFHLNRMFLLATLLLSVIIPLLHISINMEASVTESFFFSLVNGTKEFFFVYLLDEVVIYGKTSPFSWYNIVEKIYLLGISTFSLRIFVFLWQIIKLHWKSRRYKTGKINLFVHNFPYTAFSFCNAIYVNKEELQSPIFKVVWQHEVTHVNLGHTIESFLLEIWCCLFWFNPFVWAIKKQLKDIHEYQVDNSLIENGMDNITYQQHLLDYTIDGHAFSTANNFAKIALKNRVKMLSKTRSPLWRRAKFSVIIPVLLLLFFTFSTTFKTSENKQKLEINNITDIQAPLADTTQAVSK